MWITKRKGKTNMERDRALTFERLILRDTNELEELRPTYSVKDWAAWSTVPHTENEIRNTILNKPGLVCFTYLCKYSKMSADFLEELMALSTGLLTKRNYTKYIDNVKKAVQIKLGVEEGDINKIDLPDVETASRGTYELNIASTDFLRDRIDWFYIASRTDLPDWFRQKYNKQLSSIKSSIITFDTLADEITDENDDIDESDNTLKTKKYTAKKPANKKSNK